MYQKLQSSQGFTGASYPVEAQCTIVEDTNDFMLGSHQVANLVVHIFQLQATDQSSENLNGGRGTKDISKIISRTWRLRSFHYNLLPRKGMDPTPSAHTLLL